MLWLTKNRKHRRQRHRQKQKTAGRSIQQTERHIPDRSLIRQVRRTGRGTQRVLITRNSGGTSETSE